MAESREQFEIKAVDRSEADLWIITVTCASQRVQEGLEERF